MDFPEAQKALNRVKMMMFRKADFAFFSTICFSLRHVWDESIPTACTDGIYIRYNPHFFMRWSPEQQFFILLHELGHVFLKHMLRRGNRDPEKWNIAGDYVINGLWKDRGIQLIEGSLYDPKFRGMTTEQVYDLLPPPDPNAAPNPMGSDIVEPQGEPGEGSSGSPGLSSNGMGGMSPKELEHAIDNILIRARLQSQIAGDKPGTIPGEIEIYLNKLLNPKLPLKTLLRRFMTDRQKIDYSWKKPNRRFFPNHLLPSLHSEALAHVVFAVDTSGSVSDADFLRIISEVHGVMKSLKPKKISLLQFDTQIKSVDELRNLYDLSQVKFTGRGGTNIYPVMNWIAENNPTAVVLMTDGYFTKCDLPVKTPLLWMIHDNPRFTAKHGRVVHYTMDDL